MKVGILTYHSVPNFGAQLQTLSTVGYLKRFGHTPIVINWYPEDLEIMYHSRVPIEQIEAHNLFLSRYLPVSKLCKTETELIQVIDNENIDAILAGSDAIFKFSPLFKSFYFDKKRKRIVKRKVLSDEYINGNPFFGGFLSLLRKKIKAAAFSCSSQNSSYKWLNPIEKSILKKSLLQYNYISVRDEWTKNFVEDVTNRCNIKVTPDPVFSFNQNIIDIKIDEKKLIKDKGITGKYILVSFGAHFINQDYFDNICNEIQVHGYTPVILPMPEGNSFGSSFLQISTPLDPLEWYVLLKNASGYIGERMHPIIVCIHNSTPFFCFDEYGINVWSWKKFRVSFYPESSKTYLILKKAGLLKYVHLYGSRDLLPSPSMILEKIISFDKSKCSLFAQSYQYYYEESMRDAIKSIS